jgi:hypothetical protein
MSKFNYVDDYSGLYTTDLNGTPYNISTYPIEWNFLNNSSTPRIDATTYRHASRLSIEIRNPNVEAYSFESIEFVIPADRIENEFSFNAMLKCNAPAQVSIYLHEYGESFSSVEPVTTDLSTSEWTACFSNVFEFADKNRPVYGLGVRIVVSNHNGKIVHFSMPNLVEDKPFLNSTYYAPARKFFSDVYYDVDSQQTSPTFPFFKLWHSLTGVSDTVMKEYLKIFQYEDVEKPVGIKSQFNSSAYDSFSSQLTNPEIMPDHYTAWASMFIGNLIKNGIYVSGSNVIDDELSFKRTQISSRMYGFSAGTKGALKSAARSVIGEDAAVIITPNWNNNEWSIMVRTLTASTPGVSGSGQSSSAVYYTIEPAKPAGYTLMHQTIDEITFVLDDNDFGVFNQSVLG